MTSGPPQSPSAPGEETKPAAAKAGLFTIILHHSITVLILVLFLSLGVWAYLNLQTTEFFSTLDYDDLEAHFYPPLEETQRQRLETALEVYSLRYDRYPTSLNQLTEAGLLLPSDLYYPRGLSEWAYETRGDEYSLQLGPPDTDDVD